MKLIIDHSKSFFNGTEPLIYLESERENESAKYMFENGWIPYYEKDQEFWYQTRSSRLKISQISNRRKKELNKIKISSSTTNSNIQSPLSFDWYNSGNFEDFYFDEVFWGRVIYIEDQVMFAIMNIIKDKKSYGTLSYYYLLQKFFGKYEFLYITDFFNEFNYKKKLPGFQFWDGKEWI